jgi:hypothetical protein
MGVVARDRGGFSRAGAVDVTALGLKAADARRILLHHAWRKVAGEEVAGRALVTRLARGVVEIDVADPAWARELSPLLPRLCGRLAREVPSLGIVKLRVKIAGQPPRPAQPVDSPGDDPPPASRAAARRDVDPGAGTHDLLDVARRYLELAAARRTRRP